MIHWLKKNVASLGLCGLVASAVGAMGCPPPPVAPVAVQPAPTVVTNTPTTEEWVAVPTRINYDRGSSRLNETNRAMLAEAHRSMTHRTDIVRVRIDGHADDGGSPERNRLLADERARGVMDYLVGTLRMPRELFEVHSHGNTQPLTSGTTSADDATNRRVEFRMLIRRQAAY